MTTVLILEGNTADIIATGDAGSAGFVRTILALAPATELRIAAPYVSPISRSMFSGIDGVVFTGSGTAWSTNAPEAAPQLAAMELAFECELPVWGSCNGLQLAAIVLGGEVGANPSGLEVGFAQEITATVDGEDHPMMAGRRGVFTAPTVHRDHILVAPDGATVLAANGHSPVQAMVFDRDGIDFWGTQYHPELSARDIANYVRTPGIFAEHILMANDLEVATEDDAAAQRLGTSVAELHVENRASEIANWLTHIEGS